MNLSTGRQHVLDSRFNQALKKIKNSKRAAQCTEKQTAVVRRLFFFFLNMNQRGFRSRSSVAARRSRSGQVNDLVEGVLSAQGSATGLETKCG